MNEENNIEEQVVGVNPTAEPISPEIQDMLSELLEEEQDMNEEVPPVPYEDEMSAIEEPADTVLPVGYENNFLSGGYAPDGSSGVLEAYVKLVEAGNWFLSSKTNLVPNNNNAPNEGAWAIKVKECNAENSDEINTFWVNNYWAKRFEDADAIGRPIAMNNHHEIPLNSNSLKVKENTSRFSGAIWYEKLRTKNITLAGVGGIGSYIGFLLARMNPRRIAMYDNDIVEAVNMSGQLYSLDDIGSAKVDALTNMILNYADYYNMLAFRDLFTADSSPEDIMICGFDNMAARRTFFNVWEAHVMSKPEEERDKCLLIDGRLAAEEFQVLALQGNDTRAIEKYKQEWLFSDAESDPTVCSYKQTTFMANMIASTMVNIFVNFVANECNPIIPRDVPFYTSYSADTMYFKVEM